MPSSSATAAPPLEPPAERDRSSGLRTAPKAVSSLVVPKANSCRLVLPTRIAPARTRLPTTGASRRGMRGGTRDADVVGGEGACGGDGDERAKVLVAGGDAIEAGARQLQGRDLPPLDEHRRLAQATRKLCHLPRVPPCSAARVPRPGARTGDRRHAAP